MSFFLYSRKNPSFHSFNNSTEQYIEQIIDGDSIPDKFFCSICHCLVWKPRSCSSCQHLFCEKCIKTWLENSISARKCPFRCQVYVEGPCSPLDRSLLSDINIHCRNRTLGCTEIVSYDQLERHETVECQYLSQRCAECDQLVLLPHVNLHRQMTGLCVPRPITCTICQNVIEKVNLREHLWKCRSQRLFGLVRSAFYNQSTIFELVHGVSELNKQQIETGRSITTLKGIAAVQRIREQNFSRFYYLLIMLKFFLQNWSKIPVFMLAIGLSNLPIFVLIIVGVYCILSSGIKRYGSFASACLILLTILLTYGSLVFLQSVSDRNIIVCLIVFHLIFSCLLKVPLEAIEIEPVFNMPGLTLFLCCLILFSMKLILLFIRFYCSFFPTNVFILLIAYFNYRFTLMLSKAV